MNKDRFSALMTMITSDIISKIMDKYSFDEDKAIGLFHKLKDTFFISFDILFEKWYN